MILQTTGLAFGATKTKSKFLSPAIPKASAIGKTPNFSPFSSIT
jgi:hypothetical protein